MNLMKESEHLRIPFQDIQEITKNIENKIGSGGFGTVYKGELSLFGERMVVAVKQLQTYYGQGVKEFLTEIQLLSRYKHQNLVCLVGFSEQGNNKYLIYKYANNGSLDWYLIHKPFPPLTWRQRISICIDAARGLDHLHNHVEPNQRVIHRDIKSANILLDHNWRAMIADFGLSKLGRANENVTYLITNPCGTPGYCDPAYITTGYLTKENDIYSFGVVLFEVLCGRLCVMNGDNKQEPLVPLAQRCYKENTLYLIIDRNLKNYIKSNSMKGFSEIAFKCLQDDPKGRPQMDLVLKELENALNLLDKEDAPELQKLEEALDLKKLVETFQMQQFEEAWMQELEEDMGLNKLVETLQRHEFEEALKLQEAWELQKLVETLNFEIGNSPVDIEVIKAIYDMPNAPLSCIKRDDVYLHLSHGILVDEGKVWLSINDDGKTQEMISAKEVMHVDAHYELQAKPKYRIGFIPESRFSNKRRLCYLANRDTQLKIRTQFLSSDVTYAANLVCMPISEYPFGDFSKHELVYRLDNQSICYTSFPLLTKNRQWWVFELFQTISSKRIADFEVTVCERHPSDFNVPDLLFEGIQFLPIKKSVDDDEIENSDVNIPSTSNIEWDNLLPSDYEKFIYYSNKKMMKKPQRDVIFPTKEEAHSILSSGVLIKVDHEVNMWFWITKLNGKKCFMLPPTLLSYGNKWIKLDRTAVEDSRIGNVLHVIPSEVVCMCFKVPPGVFSPNTNYGCYLVYKMAEDPLPEDLCEAIIINLHDQEEYVDGFRYWRIPQKPFVGPNGLCGSLTPMNNIKSVQLPKKRKDGWSEVILMTKSDFHWKKTQQDNLRDYNWQRESTCKACFLPCISNNERDNLLDNRADNGLDNSFTLEPRYFSNITLWMRRPNSYRHFTPKLIVQGIEFRPV